MIIEVAKNEVNALKWLMLKGMEITGSDRKFEIYERISDNLHSGRPLETIVIRLNQTEGSLTANIFVNGDWFTEIGCADLSDLFNILSEHEIAKKSTTEFRV